MNALVIFETFEGQTHKVARFAASEIETLGHSVQICDVGSSDAVSFEGVSHVVLAAPVHERRHPKTFEAFLIANRSHLENRRTLMLSVSLNAAFPEGLEEAEEYLIEMKMRTGLTPTAEALVAGAVRTEEYDFFAMQVVRYVVLRGRDFDPKVRVHEFTDWDALSKDIRTFLSA